MIFSACTNGRFIERTSCINLRNENKKSMIGNPQNKTGKIAQEPYEDVPLEIVYIVKIMSYVYIFTPSNASLIMAQVNPKAFRFT